MQEFMREVQANPKLKRSLSSPTAWLELVRVLAMLGLAFSHQIRKDRYIDLKQYDLTIYDRNFAGIEIAEF